MSTNTLSGMPGGSDLGDIEVEALVSLLSPTQVGADRYLAHVPEDDVLQRMYGGQLIAQTLAAAGKTVEPVFLPQSMHGYFVRGGRLGQPLDIGVERIRDGRSFATRRATAAQGGRPVFVLDASFHAREPGEDYQLPAPSSVADLDFAAGTGMPETRMFAAFDLQEVPRGKEAGSVRPGEPATRIWARTRARLPDDPFVHASVLAYISDVRPVIAAYVPIDVPQLVGTFASLDHSIWFHRPVQMDKWVFIDYHVLSNAGSRSLVQGFVYSQGGILVATLAQEVLIRTGLAAATGRR